MSNHPAHLAKARKTFSPFSFLGLFSALLIAALIAFANGAFWQGINRPVVTPGFDGPIGGFAFNGYQRDESPRLESFPSEQELASDLQLLSKYTDQVRTYSSIDMGAVPELARDLGMKVTAGAWLNTQKDRNALEIKALLQSIRENSNITRVIVGNETVLRGDLSVAELERYLDIVRRREPKMPVSTAEPWHMRQGAQWIELLDCVCQRRGAVPARIPAGRTCPPPRLLSDGSLRPALEARRRGPYWRLLGHVQRGPHAQVFA